MKFYPIHAILLLSLTLGFVSCDDSSPCEKTYTYRVYEQTVSGASHVGEAPDVAFVEERALEQPGKIYFYQDLILVNEKYQGVHLIDNSDKTSPKKLGFITIQGNIDIVMSGQYIYADTDYSVVVIDLADYTDPQVVSVLEGVKDEEWFIDIGLVNYVESGTEEVKVGCEGEYPGEILYLSDKILVDAESEIALPEFELLSADAAGGSAGSFSRMALFDDHFYYVSNQSMHVFDAAQLAAPEKVSEVYMEWGVETIFPYEEYLFIGANNGMHIYDNSVSSDPRYLSTFAHARACDPVVVQGDLAYVTLRTGTECGNGVDQLDVVDVSDVLRPDLLASFPMDNPHGLSVDEEVLYLCEGEYGLKVFDISDPETISEHQLAHDGEHFAYDVILIQPDHLLLIGDDGLYQYDTSDPSDPILLSRIVTGE